MAKDTAFRVVLMGVDEAGALVWSAREGVTGHVSWEELDKETRPGMRALRSAARELAGLGDEEGEAAQ